MRLDLGPVPAGIRPIRHRPGTTGHCRSARRCRTPRSTTHRHTRMPPSGPSRPNQVRAGWPGTQDSTTRHRSARRPSQGHPALYRHRRSLRRPDPSRHRRGRTHPRRTRRTIRCRCRSRPLPSHRTRTRKLKKGGAHEWGDARGYGTRATNSRKSDCRPTSAAHELRPVKEAHAEEVHERPLLAGIPPGSRAGVIRKYRGTRRAVPMIPVHGVRVLDPVSTRRRTLESSELRRKRRSRVKTALRGPCQRVLGRTGDRRPMGYSRAP